MTIMNPSIKRFKKVIFASVFLMSTTFSSHGWCESKPTEPIVINPQNLKQRVVSKNVSLMIQSNQVEQAKMRLNIARGNLLPSINLGAAIASGPTFALSTISILVPFLFPSNWMDLKQSYNLLNSQTKAYYIAKLNTFASAYATYLTIVADMDLLDVLKNQLVNYQNIEEFIRLGVQAGLKQPADLMQAHAQTAMAGHQVSKVEELVKQELSLLRQMLSLPLAQGMIIERTHPVKSQFEYLDVASALRISINKAPEFEQLDFLIRAAKAAKWSQAFAFLNSGSITETRSSVSGAWSPTQVTGRVSLGASYFPNLQLSNLNIEQIQLQKEQMTFHQAQMVESVYASLVEAQKQVALASDAEVNLTKYYEAEVLKLRMGLTDLLHVLTAANNLTLALTSKIRSQNDLDNQRVTLSRLLINQEFGNVEKCEALANSSGTYIGNIFKKSDKNVSVEKFCDNQKK